MSYDAEEFLNQLLISGIVLSHEIVIAGVS